MLLSIYTWDGTQINDGSNYVSWFPRGSMLTPKADVEWSPRARNFPKLSTKQINDGGYLTIAIECKGTFHSQADTLKKLFKVNDWTARTLIVKDTSDSNRQWYVTGYPSEPVLMDENGPSVYYVTLALTEPLFRVVTPSTSSWSITATGQTKALTVLGNEYARPILTITPTTAKTDATGYSYSQWKPWYNPLSIAQILPFDLTGGGLDTAALIVDASVSNQINSGPGITAIATTIPIDTSVGGGLPTTGGICYVDTEQIKYTSIAAGNMTVPANGRGWGGTTAATHADNAVIKRSKMLASGNDLRVYVDGVEVNRWIGGGGINSATTMLWCNVNFAPKIEFTLGAAIAGSGASPLIYLQRTAANLAAMRRLPGKFMVIIGTEAFICTSVDVSNYTLTVSSRNAIGTSIAAHAIGDTVRWIEHNIQILYGNSSLSAPTTTDTTKPLIDLAASTNISWVHTIFSDAANLRTARWTSALLSSKLKKSYVYTGAHGTYADPSTEAGMAYKNKKVSGKWKAENAKMKWQLYHPAGFTTVTVTGEKYRQLTEWPDFTFQYSANGSGWTTLFTEATPASATTWAALSSHSGVALGATYPFLRMYTADGLLAKANNQAYLEMQGTTCVISSSTILQLALVAAETQNYFLDCTITNTTTGLAFTLSCSMELNKAVVINCDAETVVYDGQDIGAPLKWNTVRGPWLDLASGSNTLQFDDTGTTAVTVAFSWEDRNTL